MTLTRPEAIVFDLGGVLLGLNDPARTFGISTGIDEFMSTWIRSPAVRDFESGRIDAERFASRIVGEASLPYDAEEFLRRFDRWPATVFDGIPDLLSGLSRDFEIALLSNTNERHWRASGVADVLEPHFDRVFLSYEIGCVKPDAEIFETVRDQLDLDPSAILYFDDNPANVAAAEASGFRAFLARGPDDIRSSLAGMGI